MSKDKIWKHIISRFFKEFTEFFMPELHKDIDFNHPYKFLNNELLKISPKSKRKDRQADKLIEVKLKDGTEKWILIHIEIQSYLDEDFSSRMFKYFYRAYDKYDKNIVAISIFTEDNKEYKPDNFSINLYGTKLSYQYNVYKILEQRESELKNNSNPFALVILASLYLLESKTSEKKKLSFKIKLVELLFSKDYSDEYIVDLLDFIDILISLDKDLSNDLFNEEVSKVAKLKDKEELIGDLRKRAIKQGREEGKIEGKIEAQKEIVHNAKKLGIDIDKISEMTGLTIEEIEKL